MLNTKEAVEKQRKCLNVAAAGMWAVEELGLATSAPWLGVGLTALALSAVGVGVLSGVLSATSVRGLADFLPFFRGSLRPMMI